MSEEPGVAEVDRELLEGRSASGTRTSVAAFLAWSAGGAEQPHAVPFVSLQQPARRHRARTRRRSPNPCQTPRLEFSEMGPVPRPPALKNGSLPGLRGGGYGPTGVQAC